MEYTSAQVYPTANKKIKIATKRLLNVTRLALGSLKREAEIKQQISQEFEAHYNTSLVKSLKDQIDIRQSEVYFLREELREKKSISDINKIKNI